EGADERARGEREGRVADRNDVPSVEDGVLVGADAVEGAVPPRDGEGERTGEGDGREPDEAEPGDQPTGPGHALGPDEPVGAGFEFAGQQWRTPEDADERRRGPGEDVERLVHEAVMGLELARRQ